MLALFPCYSLTGVASKCSFGNGSEVDLSSLSISIVAEAPANADEVRFRPFGSVLWFATWTEPFRQLAFSIVDQHKFSYVVHYIPAHAGTALHAVRRVSDLR
jgi:hypothetical protein